MAIGNRGSIVIDVQAQITGYNESIERMKKALDEVDPGSSIGKKLAKGIAAAEKELVNLGREGMKRISSQGELDRLNDKLLKVGNLITDLGAGFQQVSWKDLTSGAAQELRNLEKQVNDVRQATQNIVGDGFSKLITEAPELKKVFDELKIDPNRMGLNTIEEKFTQTMDGLNKQIKDFEQKVEKSQNKINEYTALQNNAKNLSPDALGYLVGDRSKALKSFQAASGQKDVIGKTASSIPALSKAYIDEVKNLGDTILNNLGLGKARENNPELVAKLRPQIEEKIQQLLEARSTEAIQQILDDINKTLITGTSTGTPRGAGLATVAGTPERKNAVNFLTEKLSDLAASSSSKVDLDAFNFTKSFMGNYLEQLKAANYDTSKIDQVFNNLLPQMKEEEIKARFEQIAQAIVDGIRETATKAKEASEKLPKEQEFYNGLNEGLENLKAKHDQVSQAQQKVDPLVNELRDTINKQETRIKTLEEQIRQLTETNTGKENPFQAFGAETIENTAAQIEAASLAATEYQHKLEQIQSLQQGLNNLQSFAQRWFSVYGAMRLVSNAFKSIKTNIKELDDIMTEIAIVTDMSQADLWQQMPQYISLAKQYASSLKGVYEVSQLYYQQGLQQNDVMAMTEETLKMARISGLSYSQATDYMTNAVRSFRMEMEDSQRVVDVYSALAASSATSTTELATAMSKTASSAQAVGSSFENTTAMMAVMIEATREAPENIGTAMKSIISRYGEMTTNPAKLVDAEGEEMSLNKVDKALQTVGISIHDAQGQFRDFDDVIMELAASWDTIDKNTQRYIATVMAGNRQQSRFLALVSNYERLVELSEEAANSEDAATLQVMKTMDSVSAKAQQLQTSLQSMYTQTGLEEFYKGILDFTNGIIATFTQMPTIFKLPIPAILAFGQMFINVATSLGTVIQLLREKLNTAAVATQKNMADAAATAKNERIASEKDVWVQSASIADKGAKEIEKVYDRLTAKAQESANARKAAMENSASTTAATSNTSNIDFSKFGDREQYFREAYKKYNNPDTSDAEKAIISGQFSRYGYSREDLLFSMPEENNGNIPEDIQESVGALDAFKKKVKETWSSLSNNRAAIAGIRMVGSSISLVAASMGEATDGARALKGGLQLLGGAMQAVSYAAMKNPYMAIFTGVMTAVQVLSTWIETDAERLERLKKAVDESNTKYLQSKQDAKNLEDQIKKLEELEKAQHDSTEARKEYIEMSNQIAEQHPELVSGYDNEGNAIIDLSHSYEVLAKAREEAANAAKDAAESSSEETWDAYKTANNNRIKSKEEIFSKQYYGDTGEKFGENLAKNNQYLNSLWQGEVSSESDEIRNILIEFFEFLNSGNITEAISLFEEQNFQTALISLKNSKNALEQEIYKYIDSLTEGLTSVDQEIASKRNEALTNDEAQLLRQIDSDLQHVKAVAKRDKTNETDYLSEFSKASELIDNYILQGIREFEESDNYNENSEKTLIQQFNEHAENGYNHYYDEATKAVQDLWANAVTSVEQTELVNKLENKENLSKTKFLDQFNIKDKETRKALEAYYGDMFDTADLASAIGKRRQSGSTLKTNYTGLTTLGSNALKNILSVYDTIDKQIQNKDISQTLGQNIYDAYTDIYRVTQGFGENALVAQQLLSSWDDFSLAGLNEFIKTVNNSILSKEQQNDLITSAKKFTADIPVNLETEFQTFSQKISSNMEDFEKAISNVSKGMDFKEATELAQKLDKDIAAFDFKDGKYFFDDFNAIANAYFGEYDDYITNLKNTVTKDVSKLIELNKGTNRAVEVYDWSKISDVMRENLVAQGINVDQLQNVYKQFTEDQDKTTDNFLFYYANYLTKQLNIATDEGLKYITDVSAREAINMGSISGFARTILGEKADTTALEDTIKEAISSGNFDEVDSQYRKEWMDKYKDLNSSIYQALTEGFSDESIIEADDLDEAKQAALEPLVEKGWIEQYGEGMYKVVANIADFYDEIVTEINNGPGSNKDKREMIAALHNAKYEDNVYSALEDVVSNFDNFSYEAGQSLATALGTTVEMLLKGGIFSQNAQGNLITGYNNIQFMLDNYTEKLTDKEYNELRAKLEAANNKQKNEVLFANLIKNRQSLNEMQVSDLANLIGTTYKNVLQLLNDNGNGTYTLSLSTIQTIISQGKVQITDEIQQLIANEIDSIIASLNGLGDIQSKGTTKIADMQKQVAEINKLSGQNYTMQDLFTYSDTLHGFVYNTNGLIESARQMKEQLETLSGDERWAAEQMLENTRNTFLQNLDVSSILNAERITPEIETNFKNAAYNFNSFMQAIGDSSRISGGKIFEALTKGGIEAVNVAQQIMTAQGKELSASDVEAAYRREVSSLVDAIDTVTSGAGALVDETTANLINAARGKATELAGTGQYVVESAANLYDAYNELLNRLKATGEATLADINKVAALALENKDSEQQAIDALGDAAGMTYTRFGEILAQAGYELSEELMSQLTSAGIVKQLGGSKMQIADFSAFADLMGWNAGSEEYVSAFKSYNDSLIDMNRKAEKNILEEAKNLESAKVGDQFNLTQLSDTLQKSFEATVNAAVSSLRGAERQEALNSIYNPLDVLSNKLQEYGAELQNGILTIGADANLPAIIQEISNTAQQYGGLLSSEMAELADVLANVLKNYAELIQNGIKGTLTNVQADELKGLGKQLGVEVDFTKTKDGLKATQQSAIQLYNELKKIDALQGQMTLETLADSLEASNENYANVSTITARIAELQREIVNLQPGDARLQMYREELATAEDILRVRSSTDSGSFDFMSRDLPNGMQNPIDYWNSTGEAYKVMNQAAKSGYMEIQDFYNIVNEMNNMAAASGQTLSFMGQTLSGKAEDAAALIEAGMGALKNIDGEGVKIALDSLGVDFATGAADMTGDFDTGIKEMAKSQIKMLDAAIRMLEAIVAMENIDINGDGAFDLGEIFANGADSSGGFTQPVMDWLRQIDIATGGIQVGAQSLQQALLELGKVNPDSVVAIMNQLKNIDWTLGDVNTFAQIQNVLSTFFPGIQISQMGPSIFDLLNIPSDANEKTVQFQDFIKKTGLGVKEAQGVIQAIQNGILKPMSGKYGEHLGAKKGSDVYSAIESMLGLDKKGKKTFESFAGDYLTEDELQMWSKINIDYKKNGSISSSIYTASDGSTHILDPKNITEWQSEIEKIEDTIFKQQQTGRQDVANVEDSEPVTLESGFTVKGLIEAKDGGVDAWYNGTYLGNFSDKVAANAAIEAEALKRDKEARGIGNKTVITPEGTIETRADFTRKAKLSAEETQENKDFEKAVGQVYKEDADKINSLFQKGGQWENYLKTSENGERTLELPGFESIKLADDQNPADLIKQLGEDLFSSPDQFAEIPQKIAEGIEQAFGGEGGAAIGQALMQGITDSLTTLTEITPGQLPEVATAMGKVATQAQTLASINWDLIAEGIKKVTGVNSTGGENPPTPSGGTGNPIGGTNLQLTSLELSATSVNLDTATTVAAPSATTIEANTLNTGGTTIDANGSTFTGTLSIAGSSGGSGNGNNNSDNNSSNSGRETPQPGIIDVSAFTDAINAIQNAAQNASEITQGLANAINKITDKSEEVNKTADAISKLESKDVTIKGTVQGTIRASMSAKVSVTGDATATADAQIADKKITTTPVAKGNVALARGQQQGKKSKGALMGELGPELVVSNGRYYTVGDNGAEFVDLPDDAIVFNHQQTKRLLGNKKNVRGTPVKSEAAALSFATGNVSGPALASASAALAALKQIRAMWQSMLDASAKDLGSQAGRGGGGGGGGGGGDDAEQPTTTTDDIQRWYNWLRQIDKIEQDISYQEKLQTKYENDRIANGQKIYKAQKQQYDLLGEEIKRNEKLAALQKSWYDNKRAELAASSYGKIFTYDENGLQQYTGNDRPGSGVGLDILENLTRRNVNGQAIDNAATAKKQLAYLQSVGFNLSDLLYNDDGTKVAKSIDKNLKLKKINKKDKDNDLYTQMMENFWNNVDAWRDELDSLYDSYHEQQEKIIENQNKQNEILQAFVENELDVEQQLLEAIESREQALIDKLQDQKEALEKSNNKFIKGLTDQLNKEKEMRQNNERDSDLVKLQRQLAILQRSGGSASQIKSLQDQIASQQQDMYYEERQQQIDAIQEASDKQLERLDTQISIMTETLDYQKENGLLWNEVREIMETNTSEEAAQKILEWNNEYTSKSALDVQESIREFQEAFQQWTERRDDENDPLQDTTISRSDAIEDIEANNKEFSALSGESKSKIQSAARNAGQKAYDEAIANGGTEEEAEKAYRQAYSNTISDADTLQKYKNIESHGAAAEGVWDNIVENAKNDPNSFVNNSNYAQYGDELHDRFIENLANSNALEYDESGEIISDNATLTQEAQKALQSASEGIKTDNLLKENIPLPSTAYGYTFNEGNSKQKTKDKKRYTKLVSQGLFGESYPVHFTGNIVSKNLSSNNTNKGKVVKNVPFLEAEVNGKTVYFRSSDLPGIQELITGKNTATAFDTAADNTKVNVNDLKAVPLTLGAMTPVSIRDTNGSTYTLQSGVPVGISHVSFAKSGNKIYDVASATISEIAGKVLDKEITLTGGQLGGTNNAALLSTFATKATKKSGKKTVAQTVKVNKKNRQVWIPRPNYKAYYKQGGMADFTGPAWLDGTKTKPEAVLNAAQTDFLKHDLLGNKRNSLASIVTQLQDIFDNTIAGTTSSTSSDESITIENVSINFNAGTISSDYDARRAGELVKEEMLKIARKTGNRSVSRR